MGNVKDINLILQAASEVLKDLSPEILLAPDYELAELSTQRCVIVPTGRTMQRLSRKRGVMLVSYNFDVGLMFRAKELDTDALLSKAQEISERLYCVKLLGTTCTKSDPSPLYDAETMRERSQFTAVISLTYQELVS